MSDPSAPPQPTQEEIEAYYAQLRDAPAGDLLMQAVGMLATGAEAKLGRSDARMLIDALAAVVGAAEPHLGSGAEQLKTAVSELQLAQVQLERRQAGQPEDAPDEQAVAAGQGAPSGNAGTPDGAYAGGSTSPTPPSGGAQEKQTDKLWIPGRDG